MAFSKELTEFIENNKDKKIVFTNGCFDLIHSGHVSYLNEARSLGDLLVLGLNSDASVKGLKGKERPILPQDERKFLLENLKAVDFVEIFDEETPLKLIQKINPSILVKGGDWKPEQIVGSEHVLSQGGDVKSLQFIDGRSTTSIIDKIKGLGSED